MTKQGTVAMCNFTNGTAINIMKDYRCNVSFPQFIYIERENYVLLFSIAFIGGAVALCLKRAR